MVRESRTRALSLSDSQGRGASGTGGWEEGALFFRPPSLPWENPTGGGAKELGAIVRWPGRVGGPSVCLGEDGCLHYHVNPGKLPLGLGGGWAWAEGAGGLAFSGLDHTAVGMGVSVES